MDGQTEGRQLTRGITWLCSQVCRRPCPVISGGEGPARVSRVNTPLYQVQCHGYNSQRNPLGHSLWSIPTLFPALTDPSSPLPLDGIHSFHSPRVLSELCPHLLSPTAQTVTRLRKQSGTGQGTEREGTTALHPSLTAVSHVSSASRFPSL